MTLEAVMQRLEDQEQAGLQRLIDWLRIPSVSTDPAHRADVRAAAEWAAGHLRGSGLAVELRETGAPSKPGHPIVWATDHSAGADAPHILFYGHYDVQPPDPLDLWESPPFNPVIKPPAAHMGERIVARGACDDKGQVSTFLEALRAWNEAAGPLPIRLSVLLEGEEESGSINLARYLADHEDELRAADICVISDTGMLDRGRPAITYGVRGLAYTEVILEGPDQDLHSGLWGGRVANPNNELVKILAQLWDADRRVTIPGFYDGVIEPTAKERQAWARLGFDQAAALRKIGLPPEADAGETAWSAIEREWARPTCDINGIIGGYTGAGAKTVIPSKASAKVSFRLVADQDPQTITQAFNEWLLRRVPPGFRLTFIDHSGGHPGNVSTDSQYLKAATRAIKTAAGVDAALIKSGGSIPVVGMLKAGLALDTLLVGFGLDDDRVHSPNEKFELDCWRLGARTHAALIDELARVRR